MLKKIQKWIDLGATFIASLLIAAMFFVLVINVILRAIPAVGGFKWYMEFSQYANVWALLIGAAGIAAQGTNLRVELIDSLMGRFMWGSKLTKIIVDVSLILFYGIMTASGSLLSQKAVQAVSTMPQFKMGQVYAVFPVAGVLCIIAALVHLLVTVTEKPEEMEETAK
ncbi:MAG: TRAP transporter small permease subunit [Oscillospiraceae bacterium]|nr:TRAP transporter small permease subunit [Oscillospiraceae bacterium]